MEGPGPAKQRAFSSTMHAPSQHGITSVQAVAESLNRGVGEGTHKDAITGGAGKVGCGLCCESKGLLGDCDGWGAHVHCV